MFDVMIIFHIEKGEMGQLLVRTYLRILYMSPTTVDIGRG